VKTILLSGAISMVIALFSTRPTITVLRKRKLGQQIRTDGPQGHLGKSGTPTMGGIVIIIASLTGYLAGHLLTGDPMTASGLLVLFLMTGLGLVGFADDFIKLFMRRSLGLRSGAKLLGQALVGGIFAVLAVHFPNGYDLTPASEHLSFLADFGVSIGLVLFVIWVIVMASVVMGACFGFLWWNAPPAKIFMGDTGSLALGGALAGLAIVTRTDLLLLILGGLFVIITLSVVIQVGSYKLTHKRVFRMAPLQHHFELAGWAETTIVVRFWLIAGMFVALGLGIFYVG
jgi:phospho-N-acetylmuramoyl-pentapeptide-transferase